MRLLILVSAMIFLVSCSSKDQNIRCFDGLTEIVNGTTYVASYFQKETSEHMLVSPLFIYVGEDGFQTKDSIRPRIEGSVIKLNGREYQLEVKSTKIIFYDDTTVVDEFDGDWMGIDNKGLSDIIKEHPRANQ